MTTIRNILVPTDFSAPAGAALLYGRDLASQFDARLHLLHVVAIPAFSPVGAEASPDAPMLRLMMDQQTSARAALQALARSLELGEDRVTVQAPVGIPATEILNAIKAGAIDLVVMGTHGRGFVEHLLLGSVAERVVRRSPVPVLTMHGTRAEDRRLDEGDARKPGVAPTEVS